MQEKQRILNELIQWQNNQQTLKDQEAELQEQLENIHIIREHLSSKGADLINRTVSAPKYTPSIHTPIPDVGRKGPNQLRVQDMEQQLPTL